MRKNHRLRRASTAVLLTVTLAVTGGCEWQGPNSLPLPGTEGHGDGAFTVQVQLPDVSILQANSRVRVGDVTVGNVTKIERQGWHALLTLKLNGDVNLPANSTVRLGQTSLLGSVHVELAPPTLTPPTGRLSDGSLIPLSSARSYPTTEETLGAVSLLLNGGGLGQLQDIIQSLSTAFAGRESDVRGLIDQLARFVSNLNAQTNEIILATERFNALIAQFAADKPVLDKALQSLPQALTVLKDQRANLADAVYRLGDFGALTSDVVKQVKENVVAELNQLGPVLDSLANAGPAMTRSLSALATYPWPNEGIEKWVRGDYANLSVVVDLTLSRLDASFFTGTRFEGKLTELEMQWGRTIGQMPSPYTAGNPLIAPYRWDQGP